jgi:hypothetical protein
VCPANNDLLRFYIKIMIRVEFFIEVRAQRNSVIDIPCNLKYILMRSRVCELLACGVYREK